MEWWSIEVFNGRSSAARWKDAHGEALVEAALTSGAVDWAWHEDRWGVVLEVAFAEEWRWERFYGLPAVQAALDATPDPVKGLSTGAGVAPRGRACRVVHARWLGPARSSCPSQSPSRSRRKPSSRPSWSRGSTTTGPCLSPNQRRCTNLPPALLIRPWASRGGCGSAGVPAAEDSLLRA
jgi:hypothetical protein